MNDYDKALNLFVNRQDQNKLLAIQLLRGLGINTKKEMKRILRKAVIERTQMEFTFFEKTEKVYYGYRWSLPFNFYFDYENFNDGYERAIYVNLHSKDYVFKQIVIRSNNIYFPEQRKKKRKKILNLFHNYVCHYVKYYVDEYW
jgi:hypothetical protein